MSTPISKIIERFFHIIEEDEEFFDYYNLTDEESLQLATERANAIVEEALTMWKWRCNVPVSLTIIDEFIVENDERHRAVEGDLTSDEINIVARLMFEIYIHRDIAKFKKDEINFTPKDLQKFSPSNSRKTFMAMYKDIHDENLIMLKNYQDRDRKSGEQIMIDYEAYAEDGDS